MGKKEHAPSAYRKIIKAAKSGNASISELAERARALSDSYYVSLALFSLSLDKRLEKKLATELREQAMGLVEKEKRSWRRAELITSIGRMGKGLPVSEIIMSSIENVPEPEARAGAIAGTVKNLGCEHAAQLLKLAVHNNGHEADSCKPVIKFWAAECPEFEMMMDILQELGPENRVRMLGYLQLQLARTGVRTTEPIERAVDIAMKSSNKLELLKYLAAQSDDIDSLEVMAAALTGLETPLEEASLLATLGGSADRAGQKELALDWFRSSLECLEEADDVPVSLRLNLALGLRKMGQSELASENFRIALESAGDNEGLRSRIEKAMGLKPEKVVRSAGPPVSTRHVLALHDTYQGKMTSSHLRMIARAAPLCIAYGLDLALLDFPVRNIDTLARKVSADTNVGKGGHYLRELMSQNRIMLIAEPHEAGLPVATTSRPDKSKSISLEMAARKALAHPTKRLCVVMGLGRKGLPRKLLDAIEYHAEITGSNVPLETSTAMGIIAQMMGKLQ